MCSSDLLQNNYSLNKEIDGLVNSENDLERMLMLDARLYLPADLLTKIDRMGMASSLETRVPFLDYRLALLAAEIPTSLKLKHGITKYLLKIGLDKKVPAQVLSRKKQGFAVPVDYLMQANILNLIETFLLSNNSVVTKRFFDRDYVNNLIKEYKQGDYNHAHRIWSLLIFAIWYWLFVGHFGEYRKGMNFSDMC